MRCEDQDGGEHGQAARRHAESDGTVTPFAERVLEAVRALPPGDVVTYGEVARLAGRPGAARGVGAVLAAGHDDVPWWRVVNSTGRLVPGHVAEHQRRLSREGVSVRDGRVVGFRR